MREAPLNQCMYMSRKDVPKETAQKYGLQNRFDVLLLSTNQKIPTHILNDIISVIEVRAMYICSEWQKQFEGISFYC